MTNPHRPLPLRDVLDIVERRRRRRARATAVGGTALAVGAAGVAGAIVVALQNGPGPVTSAAPPSSVLVTADPTIPPAPTGQPPATARSAPVPDAFDPYARPDYVTGLGYTGAQSGAADRATEMAEAWGVPYFPDAKAVIAKADLTGTAIDPSDPAGDDELISRFAEAGYTDEDAQALAEVWGTSPHTARVLGALVLEAEG